MQKTSFLGRLGAVAATTLVTGLACANAKAGTFATFQQVVSAGNPDAAINFALLPGGTFTSADPLGNPVILNWLDACFGAANVSAYLTISGTLVGTPVAAGGVALAQSFSTLNYQFWTGANKTGDLILEVQGDGGLISTQPYSSVGGSSGGSVQYSSSLPSIQACLDSGYNIDRSTSFALTSLVDQESGDSILKLDMSGNFAPFKANISGSFSAIPEPTTLGLAFLGLAGLVGLRRKK
jgi:hypothetical protein